MGYKLRDRIVVLSVVFVIAVFFLRYNALAISLPALTIDGEAAGETFGVSASLVGDVDNDGFSDILVGAPLNGVGGILSGRAYLFSGQSGSLLHTFTGESINDLFGYSVSGAGDVNNDGIPDLIIGAQGINTSGDKAGRAYVYSGQSRELLYTFNGEAFGDQFGGAVSGAGDVNNDGSADLIIGAKGFGAGFDINGRAYVYSGQSGALLYTFTGEGSGIRLGFSVSGAGDVDGDGYADLVVGAIGFNAGRVYIYSGRTGAELYTLDGETPGDRFGVSISGADDVNNDGFADLIIGADFNSANGPSSGRAYVYSGSNAELLYTFTGKEEGDYFGQSVSGAGDVNGDGYADLIVGAPADLNSVKISEGRVYVYSGRSGELFQSFTGEGDGNHFGSVVLGGDIDSDGYSDLVISAPFNGTAGFNAGRMYIYSPRSCCDTPNDSNNDGSFNVTDLVFGISYIFMSGMAPPCLDEADSNGDGVYNVSDIVYTVDRIFSGGPAAVCGTTGF